MVVECSYVAAVFEKHVKSLHKFLLVLYMDDLITFFSSSRLMRYDTRLALDLKFLNHSA